MSDDVRRRDPVGAHRRGREGTRGASARAGRPAPRPGCSAWPPRPAHGGEGLGLAEVAVLVREVGARALDLPFRETLVCGLLTLARSGTPEQQEIFVPRIVSRRPAGRAGAQRGRRRAPGAAGDPARGRPADRPQGRRARRSTTSPTPPPCCWSPPPTRAAGRSSYSSTRGATASPAPRRPARAAPPRRPTSLRRAPGRCGVLADGAADVLRPARRSPGCCCTATACSPGRAT